jgi:hypothetical protein
MKPKVRIFFSHTFVYMNAHKQSGKNERSTYSMDLIRVNTGIKEKGRKQNTRPTVREQLQQAILLSGNDSRIRSIVAAAQMLAAILLTHG